MTNDLSKERTILRCDNLSIFAGARLVYTRHMTEYALAKTGEYPSDILQFLKLLVLWKIFEG